ncbi:MAG: nickel transporter [Burkholderiales bacterium]|nr:nickel transporter [Burkholderiales bacterium]MDE2454650.1 nickel transporter [Burkholderiales bacterium]
MLLIPVIDIMRGQVVRAKRGDRQQYRPIVSQLCSGSEPVEVARALARHCRSARLYLADLDALTGGPAQAGVLADLLRALPDTEIWVDAAFSSPASVAALRERVGSGAERLVPVFGSESLATRAELEACLPGPDAGLLSLDRRDGERLDRAGCWEAPQCWPARVIVMTLERVGADAGPDLDTLREVQKRSPATRLIGAGGVRDATDLERAERAGAEAWLVASALHDGRLPPAGQNFG